MNFAYYLLLLLIFFLSLFTIKKNLEASPKKIKVYLTLTLILFLLRDISLFLLCILKNSNIIYYLKSIIYLNYLSIPLMVLAITYIYLRTEKLSFSGSYIIATIICIVYIGIIHISKVTIQVSYLYGFILKIDEELIIFLFSLIILGVLHISNVILLDKPFVNKNGLWMTIIAISIVIIENIIILGGIKIFPYPIIGDIIFLIIVNRVLKGFK